MSPCRSIVTNSFWSKKLSKRSTVISGCRARWLVTMSALKAAEDWIKEYAPAWLAYHMPKCCNNKGKNGKK